MPALISLDMSSIDVEIETSAPVVSMSYPGVVNKPFNKNISVNVANLTDANNLQVFVSGPTGIGQCSALMTLAKPKCKISWVQTFDPFSGYEATWFDNTHPDVYIEVQKGISVMSAKGGYELNPEDFVGGKIVSYEDWQKWNPAGTTDPWVPYRGLVISVSQSRYLEKVDCGLVVDSRRR